MRDLRSLVRDWARCASIARLLCIVLISRRTLKNQGLRWSLRSWHQLIFKCCLFPALHACTIKLHLLDVTAGLVVTLRAMGSASAANLISRKLEPCPLLSILIWGKLLLLRWIVELLRTRHRFDKVRVLPNTVLQLLSSRGMLGDTDAILCACSTDFEVGYYLRLWGCVLGLGMLPCRAMTFHSDIYYAILKLS